MKTVTFIGVTILIDGKVDTTQYDLGAIRLQCENRGYILDIIESNISYQNGITNIDCKLSEDRKLFKECNYDLLPEDFFNSKLISTIYIGNDYTIEPMSRTLFIKFDGGLTKAIELINE